jgi:hypothetical protein
MFLHIIRYLGFNLSLLREINRIGVLVFSFSSCQVQIPLVNAADPTPEDAIRLRAVAKRHGVCQVLLASWKKGAAAIFFSLPEEGILGKWPRVTDLDKVFR